ncbi:hypothetical protein HDV57DRAFT_516813 [Trichoderma longibrachiatum]|uniref:Uncharacterized protein n=1 Tax=Trichoderma longibrachiatum ATCC 18648 TaxID=983965 RepID=A0A2T4C4Z2_TRILO|nr:hypothetical protein M440DRAFT_1331698 [Trichoderma longibrachiatum ATCC 18648]
MPQDANLYGQRPQKRHKREAISSSLDFTAQLTSLLSSSAAPGSTSTTSGRPRPSKQSKGDIFRGASKSNKTTTSSNEKDAKSEKLVLKEVAGTEDETRELERARRKMESKARLYAAMKRGDYVPKENEAAPLVDFDRKWAETTEGKDDYETSSSDDDDAHGSGDEEIVEFEDEFGRTRRTTRAEKERMERRIRRGLLGAEELERMSARPSAPSKLIYGDAIQAMAFAPDDPGKMEELARKRDRSATPPEMKHYDADHEIRTKGVGFYKFSKDEETRAQEMKALEEERLKTEELRKQREEQRAARRREIEQRRKDMGERRAKRQADDFLEGL